MSEENDEIHVESTDDEIPVIDESVETLEVGVVEEQDPLEAALERAETAEKEIAYKDAEIQNVRKRFLSEKSELIQYGSMGLARKMLTVLADVDRAMNNIDDDDQSPVAQGLRLLRNKMWHELSGDGVTAIDAKGKKFDPAKMDAITTIPASEEFPSGTVVDVIESGYMYKQKVLVASRVVVASED
jgi:molecular chaperone GrpE (heat shock protein)